MKRVMIGPAMVCVLFCGCPPAPTDEGTPDLEKLLIFHNNSGPMCLEALEWLDSMKTQYPGLVVEEHLVFEAADLALLQQLESQFSQSQGVSTTFAYLPIIFFAGQAFSGFDDELRATLEALISSSPTLSP